MTTEQHSIVVDALEVQIVRKAIKNLHLGVYPPDGRVRVAAPLGVSDEAVRLAVIDKLRWIKRQRARFAGQARLSEREMVSGESHYFFGRRYRLRVIEHQGPSRVVLRNRAYIELHIRSESDADERQRVLQRWYRNRLRELAAPLLSKWEKLLEVQAASWGIKKMKTKWGSCNAESGRIWLNLELAKPPVQCLEYVIVHELVHLIERHHNDRFKSLMDRYMPNWRFHRQQLNAAPLGHENWSY